MRLSKRTVDALVPKDQRYTEWCDALPGFGVRVETSGRKTFVCRYRQNGVRRQYTIGPAHVITAEEARREARRVMGAARFGKDLAADRNSARRASTVAALCAAFLEGHGPKLKPNTRKDYDSVFARHIRPAIGHLPAEAVTVSDLNQVHLRLADHPYRANRAMAYLGSAYSWGAKHGLIPRSCNPTRDVRRFREQARERYLTSVELQRLGTVLRKAETEGLAWEVKANGETAKHVAKAKNQRTIYPVHVTGAIRLLLFTGCRLREILNLRWSEVDSERGLLQLSDSKTGRKVVFLNRTALGILMSLPRTGRYVIPGEYSDQPRHDLKKPWDHIRREAGLDDVRLHDLRHTHASIGAASGLGLPIVGKLLGHKTPTTTQRYAHLADDPVRQGAETIGMALSRALGDGD